jgi:hypothetical protein
MWLYEEVGQGDVGGDHVGFNSHDTGTRRAGPHPLEQTVDSRFSTLGEHLDPAVGEIADPSDEIEFPGGAATALPVPDTLNFAGHEDMDRFDHRRS